MNSGVREAYAAHSGELYGSAVRALGDAGLAGEAVRETFVRAWSAGDPVAAEDDSVRGRLFAVLRDVLIDLDELSVEQLEQSFLAWRVEEAMRKIGEQHRRVLVETYYRRRPYAEVATELGVPEETVKSRVYDGLRALKVALAEVELES